MDDVARAITRHDDIRGAFTDGSPDFEVGEDLGQMAEPDEFGIRERLRDFKEVEDAFSFKREANAHDEFLAVFDAEFLLEFLLPFRVWKVFRDIDAVRNGDGLDPKAITIDQAFAIWGRGDDKIRLAIHFADPSIEPRLD